MLQEGLIRVVVGVGLRSVQDLLGRGVEGRGAAREEGRWLGSSTGKHRACTVVLAGPTFRQGTAGGFMRRFPVDPRDVLIDVSRRGAGGPARRPSRRAQHRSNGTAGQTQRLGQEGLNDRLVSVVLPWTTLQQSDGNRRAIVSEWPGCCLSLMDEAEQPAGSNDEQFDDTILFL